MGFPTWTLIGMGVTAVFALLMTILAYLAQSPRAIVRLGLAGQRLDLRVKLFTGYALASLILMLGFFLAGVPLDNGPASRRSHTCQRQRPLLNPPQPSARAAQWVLYRPRPNPPALSVREDEPEEDASTTQAPASGAFGGPPGSADEVATAETATPLPHRSRPDLPPPQQNR
jgi:hypothetical protein